MELAADSQRVNDVTSEQLRQYADTHHDADYAIVDVRQPEEYALGHLPGAQLFPLGELEMFGDQLRAFGNRTVVFYCRSGARSARASAWAKSQLQLPKVANLLGGFAGYGGATLRDFPRLMPFKRDGTAEELLHQALDVEKGTYLLYELLMKEFEWGGVSEAIEKLARAEIAHGKAVHRQLAEVASDPIESFDTLFATLPGNLIENGETFEAVVDRAKKIGSQGPPALLELALEIELGAYDLYKNLAESVTAPAARAALTELSQQEKQHAQIVLRALGQIAA